MNELIGFLSIWFVGFLFSFFFGIYLRISKIFLGDRGLEILYWAFVLFPWINLVIPIIGCMVLLGIKLYHFVEFLIPIKEKD